MPENNDRVLKNIVGVLNDFVRLFLRNKMGEAEAEKALVKYIHVFMRREGGIIKTL
ncbi:MAG: hypothetical protein ABI855_07550 [Bacteroidota bacterium]